MCKDTNQHAELVPELLELVNSYETSEIIQPNFHNEISGSIRSSKDYIKWVQHSLNNILGLSLTVDGIRGTKTKSAIRSFQTKNRLTVDGIVGSKTEAALIKAGAGTPPVSSTVPSVPGSGIGTIKNISALQSNIVKTALTEWARWGNGNRTEDEPAMRSIIAEYWKSGVGFNQSDLDAAWSAAFVSYVMRKAGSANTFRYSGSHAIYSYYAKQNRLTNNAGTCMAYHISEIKPLPGDIIVAERQNSGLNYDTLTNNHKSGHGDIIVDVTSAGVYVIGGNVGNSTSGARGVTVNRKRMISLSSDGYLTGSGYSIIIRAGGAMTSEIRAKQNESELQTEFEYLLSEEEVLYETTTNRKSKEYIKWVQQSLNKILGIQLAVDGDRGVKTRSAIRTFQTKKGLEVDGKVGPLTEKAIQQALAAATSPAIPPVITSTPSKPPVASTPVQTFTCSSPYPSPLPTPVLPAGVSTLVNAVRAVLNGLPVPSFTGIKIPSQARFLDTNEQATARSIFGNSIDFSKIFISDGVGFSGRPFTVHISLGGINYIVMLLGRICSWKGEGTLIHELAHAWQSQHCSNPAAYMLNSIACQAAATAYKLQLVASNPVGAAIFGTPDVSAYAYIPGRPFDRYGAEQIAQQVEDHFNSVQQNNQIISVIQSARANTVIQLNNNSMGFIGFETDNTPGVVWT